MILFCPFFFLEDVVLWTAGQLVGCQKPNLPAGLPAEGGQAGIKKERCYQRALLKC